KVLSIEQLHAAADAYMVDPTTTLFVFEGAGYAVNPAESVRAHRQASDVLRDPNASRGFKRTMVLTALVLGPV
ncbi:hypothetical protein, partial [Klebsiella michiganensis]